MARKANCFLVAVLLLKFPSCPSGSLLSNLTFELPKTVTTRSVSQQYRETLERLRSTPGQPRCSLNLRMNSADCLYAPPFTSRLVVASDVKTPELEPQFSWAP